MDPKNEHDQHADPDQQSSHHGRDAEPNDPNQQPDQPNQAGQPDSDERNRPDKPEKIDNIDDTPEPDQPNEVNTPNPTPEPQTPGTVPDWSELGRGTTQTPKGVREILKTYFNDAQIDRADQYHSFFSSWKQLAGINISAHTRPRDIRNRVLIIEADHPGWVQLLQMKTKPILRKIQRDFPQLDIKDLRIVVGELPPQQFPEEFGKNAHATDQPPPPPSAPGPATAPPQSESGSATPAQTQDPSAPEPEDQESSQHKSRFEQALENLGRQVKDRNDE